MFIKPETFYAVQNTDVEILSNLNEDDLRPILPSLVRSSLCSGLDESPKWVQSRSIILKCISGIEVVNTLVGLLSVDFHELEQDARKKVQLQSKLSNGGFDSANQALLVEFERSDAVNKLRLVVSELLLIMTQVQDNPSSFLIYESELFSNEAYLVEVADVLCIAQSELPIFLPLNQVSEALLRVEGGPRLVLTLVANNPDYYRDVAEKLILNTPSSTYDHKTQNKFSDILLGRRLICLDSLYKMSPIQAKTLQQFAIKNHKLPELIIRLILNKENIQYHKSKEVFEILGIRNMLQELCGLLYDQNEKTKRWFSDFIEKGSKNKCITVMSLRNQLIKSLNYILSYQSITSRSPKPLNFLPSIEESQLYVACMFIRVYIALKCISNVRFTDEENNNLLQLITISTPKNCSSVEFIKLGICSILAYPQILTNEDQEKHLISWIKDLLTNHSKEAQNNETSNPHWLSTITEMLLLIAIHFHSNQNQAIVDLISQQLALNGYVKSSGMSRIKIIFTQNIFTEQIITQHSINLSITLNLDSTMCGYLSIHCVCQLLKSRAFTKHEVPIKNWIYNQMQECRLPLHSQVPSLIEAYVHSIISPSLVGSNYNEPFSQSEILNPFKFQEDKQDCTFLILILYYVLLYQDMLLTLNLKSNHGKIKAQLYPDSMISKIPIRWLVYKAREESHRLLGIYPALIGLVATHHPHLCIIEHWIKIDDKNLQTNKIFKFSHLNTGLLQLNDLLLTNKVEDLDIEKESHKVEFTNNLKFHSTIYPSQINERLHLHVILQSVQPVNLNRLFLEQNYYGLLDMLEIIAVYPPHLLPQFHNIIIEKLCSTQSMARKVQELLLDIWFKMEFFDSTIKIDTVNFLQKEENSLKLCEKDIIHDPLIILRVDERFLSNPILIQVILHLLQTFLQISRYQLNNHIHSNPTGIHMDAAIISEREELKTALISAQESAAVQILLEICLNRDCSLEDDSRNIYGKEFKDIYIKQFDDKVGFYNSLGNKNTKENSSLLGELNNLREIRCLIFSYIHQIFISDPSLAKLVHFQGYPIKLIPLIIKGVPSMHICLDFLPELMSQPPGDGERLEFAFNLASNLSAKYALPKSMNVARLCIDVSQSMISVLQSDQRCAFFSSILPSLVQFSTIFPPLFDDCLKFLIRLSKVVRSHIATTVSHTMRAKLYDKNTFFIKGIKNFKMSEFNMEDSLNFDYEVLYRNIFIAFYDMVGSTIILKKDLRK